MPTNHVICAAGEGSRFGRELGLPIKPLIRLHGRTLLEWSVQSLPVFADDRILVLTQAKHRLREKLLPRLCELYPFNAVEWLELPGLTRGQLETALLAAPALDPRLSLTIFNSDTYFQSRTLVAAMADPAVACVIPCAEAEGAAWSFCRTDGADRVVEVKEKVRISPWATVGLYHFRDTPTFLARARAALERAANGNGEWYVAPLAQEYIDEGATVLMDRCTLFKPMGTPEQIERFWGCTMPQVQAENARRGLVVDLDNTITIEEPAVAYADKRPNPAVIAKLREYAAAGWEITIASSRRMATHRGDEAKVLADVAGVTIAWLQRHAVPYHGLRFGKPYAHDGFYVDDKAVRPGEFLRASPAELRALLDADERAAQGR